MARPVRSPWYFPGPARASRPRPGVHSTVPTLLDRGPGDKPGNPTFYRPPCRQPQTCKTTPYTRRAPAPKPGKQPLAPEGSVDGIPETGIPEAPLNARTLALRFPASARAAGTTTGRRTGASAACPVQCRRTEPNTKRTKSEHMRIFPGNAVCRRRRVLGNSRARRPSLQHVQDPAFIDFRYQPNSGHVYSPLEWSDFSQEETSMAITNLVPGCTAGRSFALRNAILVMRR